MLSSSLHVENPTSTSCAWRNGRIVGPTTVSLPTNKNALRNNNHMDNEDAVTFMTSPETMSSMTTTLLEKTSNAEPFHDKRASSMARKNEHSTSHPTLYTSLSDLMYVAKDPLHCDKKHAPQLEEGTAQCPYLCEPSNNEFDRGGCFGMLPPTDKDLCCNDDTSRPCPCFVQRDDDNHNSSRCSRHVPQTPLPTSSRRRPNNNTYHFDWKNDDNDEPNNTPVRTISFESPSLERSQRFFMMDDEDEVSALSLYSLDLLPRRKKERTAKDECNTICLIS